MTNSQSVLIASEMIDKAKSLGASLAGIAAVDGLKTSPSHDIYTKIPWNQGVGSREFEDGIEPGKIAWPPNAASALVIALAHEESEPELDWFIWTVMRSRSRPSSSAVAASFPVRWDATTEPIRSAEDRRTNRGFSA